jgi:cold shock CspA family protein
VTDAMKYHSTIRFWNRAKGFGFTSYVDNSGREIGLFVHCTQFKTSKRIPQPGDAVEFEIGADKASRPMATDLKFVDTNDEGQTNEQKDQGN